MAYFYGGGLLLFSSLSFLYYFLPAVVLIYFIVPKRGKNLVLLLASLFFYFYGEPLFCLVMILSSLLGYVWGLVIGRTRDKKSGKTVLALSTVTTLLPLLLFKYSDFFIQNINSIFQSKLPLIGLVLPIGISFYTFQILSYLIDVYRNDAAVQKNPLDFMTYVALFPQLIAGPIVRYQTIQEELHYRAHSMQLLSEGILRFCVGLGKKVLISNSLAEVVAALTAASDRSALSYWVCAIGFTLQIYFDFSGYSDMAIGLGRMFGFHFLENFDHPYASKSITEFWRRWHISLGSWFRDYVYIPMGGNRCSAGKWIFNILTVWFLTGFWHGAAWNFILWGLYFAAILLLEKKFLLKTLSRLPAPVSVLYQLILVNFGFVLFNANNMTEVLANLGGMFGAGGLPFVDSTTLYYLVSSIVLFLVAAVGASPLPVMLANKLRKTKVYGTIGVVLESLFCIGILLIVTAYLVDGSFNPFLYFRF